MLRSIITGHGSYLPERILTNADLEQIVETSDAWITERTGIKRRHIVAEGEFTSALATHAAKKAMKVANVSAADIELIVLATTTPDSTFPSTATKVQANLGLKQGAAFDVQAVCAGFVYALSVADNFIKSGQVKTALVIGAEAMSRIVDWEDRATCVLFGDGAGAVVLQSSDSIGADPQKRGILSSHLHSDGRYGDILYTDGGVSSTGQSGKIRMAGQEVFKHATQKMSACVMEALEANGLQPEGIDWLVPHQANMRILQSVAKKLKMPMEKVITTVEFHANTSAASIPLALDYAASAGRFAEGEVIMLEAIGGGLSWGSAVLRW